MSFSDEESDCEQSIELSNQIKQLIERMHFDVYKDL